MNQLLAVPRPRSETIAIPPLEGRRIALFSGNYNYVRDGANLALNRLVGHLERAGAQVRVYSPTSASPAFTPTGTLVSVPSIAFPGRGEYRLATGLPEHIKSDIKAFDPHLVHLSAPDILGTKALGWAHEVLGVPVVASLHTRFERYLGFYGMGFLRRRLERHLRDFYASCDYVLVPNRQIQEEMAPGGSDARIRLWGLGVEQTLFNPARRSQEWRARHGYGPDDIVVLFFGRLVLEKGVDPFIETVAELRRQGVRLRPLVVGEGPARAKLERKLGDACFTGQLVGPALATAIASADILLNPSRTEAFGNVVLEAMASGLAVVAADCGSTRNLVTHGRDGWLRDTQDTKTTARDILSLIKAPGRLAAMRHAAALAAERYHWPAILDQVVAVYAEALEIALPLLG